MNMKFLVGVLILVLATCSIYNPTPRGSGIEGQVLIGPVCPVEQQGQNCPDQPYQATLTVSSLNGVVIAQVKSDAQGHFTIQLGSHSGPVLMEMRGGAYTDEATNATMPMGAADVLTCVVPSFDASTSTTIAITPVTSMAQTMAAGIPGGMTAENIAAANQMMGSYFSVGDILHTMPMDPLVTGSGAAATQDMKNYGMTLAAMSQYARTVGMTTSSGMVTLMMNDASDGTMNGMMGSTQIQMSGMGGMMGGVTMMPTTSGTSELATAMEQFVASSMNRSGVPVNDMRPLIDKLVASSGTIR